ncbi:MAG: hypothetical protein WKF96_18100 [Solirubrobacteraceae bacterium]
MRIYDHYALHDEDADLDEVLTRPVALLAISTDALLEHGHWRVVGHRQVDEDRLPWPAYKEGVSPPGTFDVVDHTGRRRRRANEVEAERLPFRSMPTPFVLEKAFAALHGIGDWQEAYGRLLPAPDELTSAKLMPPDDGLG